MPTTTVRFSEQTRRQIDDLVAPAHYNSVTTALAVAIDRLWRDTTGAARFLDEHDPAMAMLNNAAMHFSGVDDPDSITGEGVEEAAYALGLTLVAEDDDGTIALYRLPESGPYVNAWIASEAGINGFDGQGHFWDDYLEANA